MQSLLAISSSIKSTTRRDEDLQRELSRLIVRPPPPPSSSSISSTANAAGGFLTGPRSHQPLSSHQQLPYSYNPPASLSSTSSNCFEVIEKHPIPKTIADAISKAECDCRMGIFPEINRAWFTIDNSFYLWDYNNVAISGNNNNNNSIASYAKLDQLILCAGLARPKEEITEANAIKSLFSGASLPDYLIVLTTVIQVVVLRLDVTPDGGLELKETKISAPTDGVPMRSVRGSVDGGSETGGMIRIWKER